MNTYFTELNGYKVMDAEARFKLLYDGDTSFKRGQEDGETIGDYFYFVVIDTFGRRYVFNDLNVNSGIATGSFVKFNYNDAEGKATYNHRYELNIQFMLEKIYASMADYYGTADGSFEVELVTISKIYGLKMAIA